VSNAANRPLLNDVPVSLWLIHTPKGEEKLPDLFQGENRKGVSTGISLMLIELGVIVKPKNVADHVLAVSECLGGHVSTGEANTTLAQTATLVFRMQLRPHRACAQRP
jgi:hypothetical protein